MERKPGTIWVVNWSQDAEFYLRDVSKAEEKAKAKIYSEKNDRNSTTAKDEVGHEELEEMMTSPLNDLPEPQP